MTMPNKPEPPMNSKLQQILLDFLKEDDDGNVNLDQAEKAIRKP